MELNLSYQVIRSRRKTVSIQITPAGQVIVRCPARMPQSQIRAFVEGKAAWILAHLPKEIPDPLTEQQLQELSRKAKLYFPERVAYFAPKVGVSWGRITIRCQKTRWGSCSARGNLNFNCLLMLAPPEVADYVVVHELCHRKHMNHGPEFWGEVAQVMPDYALHRQWLRQQGNQLLAILEAKN